MDKTALNLAMLVEYDGSAFYGFQKQKTFRSIQGELESVLSHFANSKIDIVTSGRTDTGVHATHQIINFKTYARREPYSWVRGINSLLSKDIAIKAVRSVSDDFSARFSAISRTYQYYLLADPVRPAILRGKIGWYYMPLDLHKMEEALQFLIGKIDFSCFRASDCQANNPVRTMSQAIIAKRHNIIKLEFTANAFLYHMIRNIVGALIYVGNGKLSIQGFSDLIESKNRKLAPPTFMADGLYLTHVEHKELVFPRSTQEWLF